MKLKTLANAYPALTKLAGQNLPLPILYRFSKVLEAFEPDIRFFMEQREKLFATYGTIDGNEYVIPPENAENFAVAFGELEELEIAIDAEALGLPFEFPLLEDVNLSYIDMKMLNGIVILRGGEESCQKS